MKFQACLLCSVQQAYEAFFIPFAMVIVGIGASTTVMVFLRLIPAPEMERTTFPNFFPVGTTLNPSSTAISGSDVRAVTVTPRTGLRKPSRKVVTKGMV